MSILLFLLSFSILIFIHELGHFLVARYFGVKVEVFSIGFGTKIYKKQIGDTLWSVGIIPLGGYVKMKGQSDTDLKVDKNINLNNNIQDSYTQKTPLQRIAILLAGPLANFILAGVLYFFAGLIGVNTLMPIVGEISKNSPASKTELLRGDEIVSINNNKIFIWQDITKHIQSSNLNSNIKFVIKRDNNLRTIYIQAKVLKTKNIFGEDVYKKMIGIGANGNIEIISHSPISAFIYAINQTYEASKLIFLSIQKLIIGVVSTDEIGGIITIGKVVSDANSIVAFLVITALISVNLGVLNLLPIPALDGGHIMFNIYEYITKRPPSDNVFMVLTIMGWGILIALMALGLYNDINRLMQD
jgi:regulator of sigma E protease